MYFQNLHRCKWTVSIFWQYAFYSTSCLWYTPTSGEEERKQRERDGAWAVFVICISLRWRWGKKEEEEREGQVGREDRGRQRAEIWSKHGKIFLQIERGVHRYLLKEMATHSSILAWKIPRTEEPSRLQSMEIQRVGHNWMTNTFTFFFT